MSECGTCGAEVGNPDRHAAWHRQLEEDIKVLYLASCGETMARIAALIGEQG